MTHPPRVPLVLVSGLAPGPNAELAELLRVAEPGTAVVHHDLRDIHSGVVRRRLRLEQRDQLTVLELAHGCVSCTLREDLLPLLRRLARMPQVRRIVVRLDEAMEPEPVSWAIRNVLVGDHPVHDDVDLRAVLTVVGCATWLADATGDDALAERNLQASPEDDRTVAQVALSQVEFADVLVLAGAATDAWGAAKASAVLDRVAPSTPRVELSRVDGHSVLDAVPADARRGEVTDMHGALLRGQPPLHADCGIGLVTFTAERPFHPQRLHDALDVLLDGVVRTRGRAWVAKPAGRRVLDRVGRMAGWASGTPGRGSPRRTVRSGRTSPRAPHPGVAALAPGARRPRAGARRGDGPDNARRDRRGPARRSTD